MWYYEMDVFLLKIIKYGVWGSDFAFCSSKKMIL